MTATTPQPDGRIPLAAAAAGTVTDAGIGVALAVASALSYSLTIVVNRTLATAHVHAATALGARFTIAFAVLVALLRLRGEPILPARGERLRVLGLGAIGYGLESTLFFMALERGTAAAVALMFYAYPAIVTVLELATRPARLTGRTLGALLLSVSGTAVVVGAGSHVAITAGGVACALGSAASFAVYLIASDRLVTRSNALTTGTWVAGGCALSFLVRGAVTEGFSSPSGHWVALAGNGLATASAFVFMFAALRRLGASRTSVVMTFEAVGAVVLAALFLGEHLSAAQLAGGAAVVVATALIGLAKADPAEL